MANLLFILAETNSVKGKGLEGEFVYSWDGKNLVLLPINSQEYQNSLKYTSLQKKSVGIKDLVVGYSYTTKKQDEFIYMGYLDWYDLTWIKNSKEIVATKQHIFYNNKSVKKSSYYRGYYLGNFNYIPFKSLTSFATKDTDVAVNNYASLLEDYLKSERGCKPVRFETEPVEFNVKMFKNDWGGIKLYQYLDNNAYIEVNVSKHKDWQTQKEGYIISNISNIYTSLDGTIRKNHPYQDSHYRSKNTVFLEEDIKKQSFVQLYVILTSGKKVKFEEHLLSH